MLPCGPGNDLCPANQTKFCGAHTNNDGVSDENGFAEIAPWGQARGYHIRDLTCGLNDPNGPVYDAAHGVYHLFYQAHIGIGPHGGTSWGHVASRDMKKWVHLPIALWNDQGYDGHAIYSGSTTIVDGVPTIVYPGLCNQQTACDDAGAIWSAPDATHPQPWCNLTGTGLTATACVDGVNLCSAVPADPSDPFMTNFSKRGPIVNGSLGCAGHCNASAPGDRGKDPSAAWQTPSGEWQMVTGDAPYIYGSMDFKVWYFIGLGFTNGGQDANGAGGDCPSFFPLPALTPGAGPATNASAPPPTHCHMAGGGGMTLGWYTPPTKPKTLGVFARADPATQRKSDHGKYYATKDFFDPVKKRRVLWGWGVPPLDAQSLPREVTWNPELQQLCYAPLEEQAELRLAPALATPSSPFVLQPDAAPHVLGPWPGSVGNQSEVQVTFALPTAATTIGLVVMGGADVESSGTLFFVDFTLPSSPDDAIVWPRTVVVGAMTNRTAATKGGNFNCGTPGVKCYNDTLQLTARDRNITLRAFVDNNVAECYWQDNRVASFVEAPATVEAAVALFSTGNSRVAQTVESVEAWQVGDIWISPEELLATPRTDGKGKGA
jgi:beta-fructofuranosidase